MKIFYFSGVKLPSQNPNAVHAMKMAQAFAKSGHNVTLFARSVGSITAQDLYQSYDTQPCFDIRLTSPVLPFALSALQAMKHQAPDLIYGHDIMALSMAARTDVPIVLEAHSFPGSSVAKIALAKLLQRGNLKAIITVCDILKQEFLTTFPTLKPEQIFVAHDGADLVDYIAQQTKDLETLKGRLEAFNIGYAGSLHPGKGMALITRMAKIRPYYDFHILGGTQKQVQRLQTENRQKNIHFYGHRDHAEVPSYLKAFDICIAPYQHRALIKTGRNTSRWISPMKLFEYMAAEKPILCSNLPIIREILDHEHNALLLPASDEHKWVKAIDKVKSNPAYGASLGRNAYDSLKEKYTWDKRASAIIDFALREHSTIRFAAA